MDRGIFLDPPSPADWQTLQVIYDFQCEHAYPTLREIATKMNLRAVSAVRLHLLKLAELELVTYRRVGTRRHMAARTIRLTPKGMAAVAQRRASGTELLYVGTREIRLTNAQYAALQDSDVSPEHLPLRTEGEYTIVTLRNWREREYWGKEILDALGFRDENGKAREKDDGA